MDNSDAAMIIDRRLPVFDVVLRAHQVADADPETTWRALRDLDLMQIRTPLTVAAFWARDLPDRLRGRQQPPPPQLRLPDVNADAEGEGDGDGDLNGLEGWIGLGEEPGREIAFGAVGEFWKSSIEWREVPLEEFASFDEPGFGKIAANFSIRPYGNGRSLVSYECRVATTDEVSRRSFGRYWRVIRPFVAHIMGAAVRKVASDAEESAR